MTLEAMMPDNLLTLKEAAELLPGRPSIQTLRNWTRAGLLPFHRLGRRRLFCDRADLQKLLVREPQEAQAVAR